VISPVVPDGTPDPRPTDEVREGALGVVLCAGASSRMGQPKALLDAGGESFLQRTVRVLREAGVDDVLTVVGPDRTGRMASPARAAGAGVAPTAGTAVLTNPDPGAGILSSLQVAVREARRHPRVTHLLVVPVDLPCLESDTVRRALDAAASHPGRIVRPTFQGVGGHPVVFPASVFAELLDESRVAGGDPGPREREGDGPRAGDAEARTGMDRGARAVLARDPSRILTLPVDDPGVVTDVDTPDDYRRVFGRRPIPAPGA
jgi:molybdenum cofactor cytidylyltransferase